MARFLGDNFPGHLDRWSPPPSPGFFAEAFWLERLAGSVDEFHADRAVRFVMQGREAGRFELGQQRYGAKTRHCCGHPSMGARLKPLLANWCQRPTTNAITALA